jgi:cupin fold WbuC family metalloprotein
MKRVTSATLTEMMARAAASPRQRSHYNLHEAADDPVQRLFVAAKRDSYFRVHRHPAKWEFSLVVRGLFDVLTFDDTGLVLDRIRVGPAADIIAFELPANTWHAWLPQLDDSAFFEVKQGPYDPATAAEFASWAPAEGAPEAALFASKLQAARVGERVVDG